MKQETILIESPEKIRFRYKIAHTGTRIGAYLVDIAIQTGIIFLLVMLFFALGGPSHRFISAEMISDFQLLVIAFLYLVYFFFQWGYFTFFEIFRNGQSPGKRALRICVIKSNGEPLEASSIVLRNLLRAVDSFPLMNAIGGFISLMDNQSRRLGDIVADTVVVHEIRFDLKEPEFTTVLSPKSAQAPAMELITRLNEEELYVIRRFLNEYRLLSPERQKELAQKLADRVKHRLKIVQTETSRNPLIFLERVYREHADGTGPNIK